MITAIIIDDESKNISTLSSLLRDYCPQVQLLANAGNAAAARELIAALKPELIFLDIEMPYGSGFDLLRSLPGLTAEVVFVTAFDQYAINAFRYAALDYLLKPVNIDQLETAVRRAELRIAEKNTAHNYELLLSNIVEKDPLNQNVVLTDKGQQYFIKLADIKYIIADGSYTHIHTDKRTFVSTKNLKDFETLLPATFFFRIHHGHIINSTHIVKVQKGRGGAVHMKDGKVLEVSVRRKDEFIKALKG